jgi:hypothetical protein
VKTGCNKAAGCNYALPPSIFKQYATGNNLKSVRNVITFEEQAMKNGIWIFAYVFGSQVAIKAMVSPR